MDIHESLRAVLSFSYIFSMLQTVGHSFYLQSSVHTGNNASCVYHMHVFS